MSSVCRLSVVEIDPFPFPPAFTGANGQYQEDECRHDRNDGYARSRACPRAADRRAQILYTESDKDHDQVRWRDVLHDELEDGWEPDRCPIMNLPPSPIDAEHPREVDDLHACHHEDQERADPEIDGAPEPAALREPERQDRADGV